MTRIALLSVGVLTITAASAFVTIQKDDGDALFNHQTVHVRDLPKSAAFYEKVLGLKRIDDPFKDDLHVFFQTGAVSELHLVGGAKSVARQDISQHMAFSVSSVDDFVGRLRSMKVTHVSADLEEGKITTRPDGVKQVYFQDPDGYWIEVNDAGRPRRSPM